MQRAASAEKQDVALAQRIAGGDSRAEHELFLRFGEQIKALARMRLKSNVLSEDLEDIVSEVQVAVLLSLRNGRYDPSTGKSLAAYIAGIAAHILVNYFRKQKKEKFIETCLPDEVPGNPGNQLSELIDEERGKKLRECLGRLKPKYKEVLLLRIYEKRSIEEIAQQLNIERRRVSERIHYAFQLLGKECRRENYFSIFSAFLPIL